MNRNVKLAYQLILPFLDPSEPNPYKHKWMECQNNRYLKQEQRQWLRECHITINLISKNNSSGRPARAFYILIHFFAVLILTTRWSWNDQIWSHVEEESTWQWIFNFLSKYEHYSHQFYYWNVYAHFPSQATWSNHRIIMYSIKRK